MLDVTNPNATGWMVKRVKETLEELEGDLNKGLVAKAFFNNRFWDTSIISIQGDSKGRGIQTALRNRGRVTVHFLRRNLNMLLSLIMFVF